MPVATETPRYLAPTPVKRGREEEFESFIRDVIVPAVRLARPDLADQWQALRPSNDQGHDETRSYVFVFYGHAPIEDWDLDTLLPAALGQDEGTRRSKQFNEFVDGEQILYSLDGQV